MKYLAPLLLALASVSSPAAAQDADPFAGEGINTAERCQAPWESEALAFDTRKAAALQVLDVSLTAANAEKWAAENKDKRSVEFLVTAEDGKKRIASRGVQKVVFRVYAFTAEGEAVRFQAILAPERNKLSVLLPAGFDFAGTQAYVLSDCGDLGLSLSGDLVKVKKGERGKKGEKLGQAIPSGLVGSVIQPGMLRTVSRGDGSGFLEGLDRDFPENAGLGGVSYSGLPATFCPETGGYCDGGRSEAEGRLFPAVASLWTNEASFKDRWVTCGDGSLDTGYLLMPVIRVGMMLFKNISLANKKRC